ncbi:MULTISPECIES: anhydro-N-acetylmuramic acid kinase [Caulobacter]|uniref:Anhydro-N-acetylmuramic acid kinase n=1 Tax=Caulobacter vibrioides OR37 TaxID=1292034 RepID=R0D5V0_CAUVI|nr:MULTISPECIES: anhydro-N-acetylmuramic acid kinase [Caulobacter]ENZ83710.1 molecular chaperone [Caulobacter vibrioides OR37]MBQ1560911.1 anhydro-N-acetylmuramic acid kinase [Caulobacter sp.]HXH47340.1 anhydro-N-acetylmuramic acid kinase [Bradyrhizobium sp.]
MRILGFMTGTSLDAVDMAVLETDGNDIQAFGPAGERKLREETRDLLLKTTDIARAWPRGAPEPAIFDAARKAVADEHFHAASDFLREHGLTWDAFDLLGVHGQTVLHERPSAQRPGRTVQLLDAQRLARATGRPVAFDFRTADVAAGGEGAPLAPIYHAARARASGLAAPVAALNVGGVANITLIGSGGELLAFDTGPGNGMIDLMLQGRGLGRFDEDGRLAAAGRVDEAALKALLASPYFDAPVPKSLDRYDFSLDPVADLSPEDAAATLVAFTAEGVFRAFSHGGETPSALIVCGGGRHNPMIMRTLAERAPVPVDTAEAHGWRGDSIEAEAFAYLAARTAKGLPISFPGTTGVKAPMTGGRIVQP